MFWKWQNLKSMTPEDKQKLEETLLKDENNNDIPDFLEKDINIESSQSSQSSFAGRKAQEMFNKNRSTLAKMVRVSKLRSAIDESTQPPSAAEKETQGVVRKTIFVFAIVAIIIMILYFLT